MTAEQFKEYGTENCMALDKYKKEFLPQGTATPLPEVVSDLKPGTILTQYWLNSMTYYMVLRTTKKSVVLVEVPDIQVSFDHDGGGTGHRYCMPDFARYAGIKKRHDDAVATFGSDPLLAACLQENSDLYNRLAQANKETWVLNRWPDLTYIKPITKRVHDTPDGKGFWITPVRSGTFTGSMHIWDGTVDCEYYGD